MSKTRCISEDILNNDNFVSLPNSAKVLYIYINLETDDEGFCDKVGSIMAILKSKPKDLQLLIEKGYIYEIKDWLYLETHFWMNNKNLRRDRIKPSRFRKYLCKFILDERGQYDDNLQPNDVKNPQIDDKLQPNDVNLSPQTNITKHNINQSNNNLNNINTVEEWKSHLRGTI